MSDEISIKIWSEDLNPDNNIPHMILYEKYQALVITV